MMNVTIQIIPGSKIIEIPFKPDTNVQEALETAYDQEKAAGRTFSFALQYFGYFGQDYGGYQVIMIDKIYDNPDDPNDYWKLSVNGRDAQVGIDSYMVNAGDVVEFDYVGYEPSIHDTTILKSKLDFYKNQ